MKEETKTEITLQTISTQLENIERRLEEKDVTTKNAKDWNDIKELGGLFLLGAGIVYLFMTGGIGAIIEWVKNIILPG
mgnify:CR=1 FL=1